MSRELPTLSLQPFLGVVSPHHRGINIGGSSRNKSPPDVLWNPVQRTDGDRQVPQMAGAVSSPRSKRHCLTHRRTSTYTCKTDGIIPAFRELQIVELIKEIGNHQKNLYRKIYSFLKELN